MNACPTILAAALLACSGAAAAQIKVIHPKLIAQPPGGKNAPQPASSQTKFSVPLQTIQQAPAAPPAAGASPASAAPGSGGTLIGSPLPPPPEVPQAQAQSLEEDATIEPAEVVVVSADMREARQVQQQAQNLGLSIKRRSVLGNLGLVVSVLRVPTGADVASALAQMRQAMPSAWVDANHRYRLQAGPNVYGPKLVAWPTVPRRCGLGVRLGMIDTPIALAHPAFGSAKISARSFLPSGVAPAPADHGTAIASLLVGGDGYGLMPGARLSAAAVFRRGGARGANTTAELVARGLDWLVGQKVDAVNLSFGGPRNQLLEAAILRVERSGVEVLAAAGNGGGDAPSVYPAAQPGVVAVTAVDAKLRPYARANRGDYIAFAAPGVDIWAAAPGGGGRYRSGTSFALPFATAIFAGAKEAHAGASPKTLASLLEARARDLGAPGRDAVFGWGLLQAAGCARPARRARRKPAHRISR